MSKLVSISNLNIYVELVDDLKEDDKYYKANIALAATTGHETTHAMDKQDNT